MNKKMIKISKISIFFLVLVILFQFGDCVNAGFFSDAMKWYDKGDVGQEMTNSMNETVGKIISEFSGYIEVIGTVVIVIATIVLGFRYLFASAEGKTVAKENIINLLVACLLFFGWTSIQSILIDGTSFVLYRNIGNDNIGYDSAFDNAMGNVFAIFKFIAQLLAFIAILYVGIKYIFSGAEGRADLKSKSFPFIIGIILAFSAVEVLNIISKIINETI